MPFSRRAFIAGSLAFGSLTSEATAQDDRQLLDACSIAMNTVSSRVMDYLWDDDGSEASANPSDLPELTKLFGLFVREGAPKTKFLLTSRFVTKQVSKGDIEFSIPHADPSGVSLGDLLQQRVSLQPVPKLKLRGDGLTDRYALPRPVLTFPRPIENLYINVRYLNSEKPESTMRPISQDAEPGRAEIQVSSGFIRAILKSCIYAYPVVRDSRTLLWPTLSVMQGRQDSILVDTDAGPVSISLLPLFVGVESGNYSFKEDQHQVDTVLRNFREARSVFLTLHSGGSLDKNVDRHQLLANLDVLNGISELFFLTVNYILLHEVAHAAYLHRSVQGDSSKNHEQELLADQAAILQLFMIALTDTLEKTESWVPYWRFSQMRAAQSSQALLWFERLFGFGIATNIGLRVLGNQDVTTHPEIEERWRRNMLIWNNCALAFSKVAFPK